MVLAGLVGGWSGDLSQKSITVFFRSVCIGTAGGRERDTGVATLDFPTGDKVGFTDRFRSVCSGTAGGGIGDTSAILNFPTSGLSTGAKDLRFKVVFTGRFRSICTGTVLCLVRFACTTFNFPTGDLTSAGCIAPLTFLASTSFDLFRINVLTF